MINRVETIPMNEYIRLKIQEGYSRFDIRGMYQEAIRNGDISGEFSSFDRLIRKEFASLAEHRQLLESEGIFDKSNAEIISKAVDLFRQKQNVQDHNRVNVKIAREASRVSNALETFNRELISEIPRIKITGSVPKLKTNPESLFGVIQLSDHHMNELIHVDEVGNRFDFTVASQRLRKLVIESSRLFQAYGVTKIFVAVLGDLMNSDRRLDEILHASTNRARATLLACYLYRQMFEDLVKRGFTLSVAAVTGNESRAGEFNYFSDIVATDNYDYTIFNILRIMFENEKKVVFYSGDWKESYVSVSGVNMLLTHGESIKTERDIRDLYSKWANKGKLIDFILHGHYHSTAITDLSARSASLCGANAYSDKQLNLYGKASQNIHVVMKDKSIHNFRIDLQNVEGVQGYDIVKELEEYHAKSARKLHNSKTTLEVVI